MTERKVSQLKSQFPNVDESSLLELLVSCNGSITSTRLLLTEEFPDSSKKHHQSTSNTRQQNIRQLFGANEEESIKNTRLDSNKPVYLYTKQSIESTIPYATCHFNFLPQDVADSLLENVLYEDDKGFKPQEFHLFGNKCISNHVNKLYTSNIQSIDDYYYNGDKIKTKNPYSDEMKIVQLIIEDQVNKELAQRSVLPFQNKDRWKCDIAVCNKFIDKSNDLDWHSDRLTHIGPHCVIASLTLGATREFRVRKQYNDSGSKFNTIYSIPLPHNTLLIMHAGFQEEYKHCVSSSTQLDPHPISGSTRINFTYRNYLDIFTKKLPMCPKCGYQMDLRRSYKTAETRGRYIWLCTGGYQQKECNGFYWANFKPLNKYGDGDNDNDEPLYTSDLNDCSIWIPKTDHEALKCFRNWVDERLLNDVIE